MIPAHLDQILDILPATVDVGPRREGDYAEAFGRLRAYYHDLRLHYEELRRWAAGTERTLESALAPRG